MVTAGSPRKKIRRGGGVDYPEFRHRVELSVIFLKLFVEPQPFSLALGMAGIDGDKHDPVAVEQLYSRGHCGKR
jgi:hypothetical protein